MFGTHLSRLGSVHRLGLVHKAIGILRKYGTNAHVYLPGVGTISGITAGNYLDSAGTTTASVDNPVGLSLDALQAMTLGAELAPAYGAGNGWTTETGWSLGANQTTATSAGAGTSTSKAIGSTNGNTYQVTFTLSGYVSGSCYATLFNGVNGPAISANGTYTCTLTRNYVTDLAGVAAATPNFSGTISGLSIKQIPGVHARQATTANKPILRQSAGRYSWQFDGVNDSLSLSAPLFQMSDDHAVIAGFNAAVINKYIFSQNNTAATTLVASLRIDAAGAPNALWQDDSATLVNVASSTSCIGLNTVATGVKIGNAKRLRVNGVQQGATNNTVLGATTLNNASIGSYTTAGNFQGSIYPVIAIKGTVSDADLLTLERFVGQLSGVSI